MGASLLPKATPCILFLVLLSCTFFTSTDAYDPLDPNGNITIKWDIISWTPDGYVAVVTMNNFQTYRHISDWSIGWTWAKNEVIWMTMGGMSTEQGDCSKYKGNIPESCTKDPTIVDLLPGTPYNRQIENCCKGGMLSSWVPDPTKAVASFQVTVGNAGNTDTSVKLPKNFTLKAPGPGYTCGPAKVVKPTKFITPDKRRVTQAMMTWKVVCTYSQFLDHKPPTCCVSLSSFQNNTIVPCPTCSCGLPKMNYSDWNLVLQHPNFNNRTQVFGFNYNLFTPYSSSPINDVAMLWGIKSHNDILNQAGPNGNVQAVLLFRKDKETFTSDKSWVCPQTVYFNGDKCMMPPSSAYPF